MQAEIITIGDELLIGQVVDTNSAWMAQRLNELGIELKQITSVHDDEKHIYQAIDDAFCRADIVLTTGGLGPTKDDITKEVLCRYFYAELVPDEEVEKHIRQLYSHRPDVLNRLTESQWMVPDKAEILPNRVGSAPIMIFHLGEKILCAMPGVPYEMQIAMQEQVLPYCQKYIAQVDSTRRYVLHRTALVYGIAESALAIHLEEWENALPENMHLAYLPKDGTIRLRLSYYGDSSSFGQYEVEWEKLCSLVSDYLVSTEDLPLEVLVGQRLKAHHLTVATAESCTGGKLASLLNRHAGSSAFYVGSVVAYANELKQHLLHVSENSLQEHGAVSEEVVRQMAEGVRRQCGSDFAIATSGIAGPDGGMPDKPVGTVWMAWATPEKTYAEVFHLGSLREQITDRACNRALIRLLQLLPKD